MMMKGLLLLIIVPFSISCLKDNKPKKNITPQEKLAMIEHGLSNFYCPGIKSKYYDANGKLFEHDSALFAGLAGTSCPDIDVGPFENQNRPGQMCRTWECDSILHGPDGKPIDNGSDSLYSKDMNAGILLNQAVKPVPDLVHRITSFLNNNRLQMCFMNEALDKFIYVGKCLMPPQTFARWVLLDKRVNGSEVQHNESLVITGNLPGAPSIEKVGYEAHLAIIGILSEAKVYNAISDQSMNELEHQTMREPKNALYAAAYAMFHNGDMLPAINLWLNQCPLDRFPNNHQDRCIDYLYSRDEGSTNSDNLPNWEPCPQRPYVEHPGVDCAIAGWVILQGLK